MSETTNERDAKHVVVVRRDLKMPPGKLAAQVGHAARAFVLHRWDEEKGRIRVNVNPSMEQWLRSGTALIVLGVDSLVELETIADLARVNGVMHHVITDAARTCFSAPTKTCVGIGPAWSDVIDRVTGGLKLL